MGGGWTCLYLCEPVRRVRRSGIVNTDSFQLESALSNKQTSGEEERRGERQGLHRKNMAWGGGGVGGAQVGEQSMLGMQMKAMEPSTRSTGRSEWQPRPV